MAVSRAVEVTGLIRQALANDTEARIKGEKCGFAELIQTTSITGHSLPETPVQMADVTETHAEMTQLK